jgi:hypothetical protein
VYAKVLISSPVSSFYFKMPVFLALCFFSHIHFFYYRNADDRELRRHIERESVGYKMANRMKVQFNP